MRFGFIFSYKYLALWLGVGAAAIAAVVVGLLWLEKRRQGRLAQFMELTLAPRLLPGYDASLRRPLFWLTVAGLYFLLCFGLARLSRRLERRLGQHRQWV